MNNTKELNKNKSLFDGSIFGYTWKSRGIVFLINITVVAIFILIGYFFADRLNKNPRIFVIVSVLVSFPVSQYLIYKKLRVKKHE